MGRLAMLLGTTLALGTTLDVPTSPVRTPRRRDDELPPTDVIFGFGDHVITDVTHVSYSASARPPNDHGATPAERAVTRGPTRNPGRLTRRERRRRAGR